MSVSGPLRLLLLCLRFAIAIQIGTWSELKEGKERGGGGGETKGLISIVFVYSRLIAVLKLNLNLKRNPESCGHLSDYSAINNDFQKTHCPFARPNVDVWEAGGSVTPAGTVLPVLL